MNFTEHLDLYKRNWVLILIAALVVFAGVHTVGSQRFAGGHDGTIFLTIGTQRLADQDISTSYDDALAADNFSETVSGWFKNPVFVKKISETAGVEAGLAGRRQERLNVVVTYSTATSEQAQAISTSTRQILEDSISEFNSNTNRQFKIARYESQIQESASKSNLLIFVSLVLALAAAVALAYVQEYIRGTVSWKHQITSTLLKEVDFHLTPRDLKNNGGSLPNLIKYLSLKNPLLAGINFDPSKIAKIIGNSEHVGEVISVSFPGNAELGNHTVLLCKLGTTKQTELRNIRAILPEKYLLVSFTEWS